MKVCFITLTFFDHRVGYSDFIWAPFYLNLKLSTVKNKMTTQLLFDYNFYSVGTK